MYKVGDFSKISRVSAKALRYYDERGLLKPSYVDDATGYRYYSIEQLPRLNRILVLKELGLSLEQIGVILDAQVSHLEMRGMLRLKQAELHQQIELTQLRLSRVERRLKQIEQEDSLLAYDIVLKNIDPQMIISAREIVPFPDKIAERCIALTCAVVEAMQHSTIRPLGLWGTIYHDVADELYTHKPTDVEVATIVDSSSLEKYAHWHHKQIHIRELSGSPSMACLVHTGDYQGLWDAYAAILLWIATNSYQVVGPCRIFYLRQVRERDNPVSEIQIPVTKVPDTHV